MNASPVAEVLPAAFDYAALDSETRIVVQQRTSEIRTIARRAASDVIDIGQKLIEVKERLGHGKFGQWLQAEFQWSEPSAQRFMRVADRFQNRQIDGFAPSALYMLAAPSVPDEARDEAVQRAEAGEKIGVATAKDIIDRQYAGPLDLVPGVRAWLESSYRNNTAAQRDVLNQIKIQSPAGRDHLAKLMQFPGLPSPHRASDLVAAARLAFDEINAEAQARIAKVVITDPTPEAPARAPVYELERALSLWLKQFCATPGEERVILEDIKAKRDPWYTRLFVAPTLPPNRVNGDVLQAAHNLLDHLNQADARTSRVVITDPRPTAGAAADTTSSVDGAAAPVPAAEGRCTICNRPLTDPAHVAAGCGPVCAAKAAGNGTNGAHAAPLPAGPLVAAPDYAAIVDAWLAQKVEDAELPDDRQAHIYVLTQIVNNTVVGGAADIWKDLRNFDQWPAAATIDDKRDACRVVLARLSRRPVDAIPPGVPAPPQLRPIDLEGTILERNKRRIRQLERALGDLIEFVKSLPVPEDLAADTDEAVRVATLALRDVTYA